MSTNGGDGGHETRVIDARAYVDVTIRCLLGDALRRPGVLVQVVDVEGGARDTVDELGKRVANS